MPGYIAALVATSSSMARLGRASLVAVIILLGLGLFATAWWTDQRVGTATGLLVRGQADILHDAVDASLGGRRGEPIDGAALAEVVDELADNGLRYLVLLDSNGSVLAEAGEAKDRPNLIARAAHAVSGEPTRVGDRIAVVFRGASRRSRRISRVPEIAMEFDDRVAGDLRGSARWTLVLGALAAIACFIAAAALLRWLLLRQARQAHAEQERRLASLGQMSAILAHELRNPLASLKGNAQLLARMVSADDKQQAKAERVVLEAQRLESLTNDLLEFARTGELHIAEVPPADVLRSATENLDGSRISLDVNAAPPSWRLDAGRLRQVLANLLQNALQASEEAADRTVQASVFSEGDEVVFTVRDHGPGIAPTDLEHLFEPFFTRRVNGTGLGLAVARRLVELRGGTLSAANGEVGAIFTVRIPR